MQIENCSYVVYISERATLNKFSGHLDVNLTSINSQDFIDINLMSMIRQDFIKIL